MDALDISAAQKTALKSAAAGILAGDSIVIPEISVGGVSVATKVAVF
jgi:hypothetical protein